MPGQSWAEEGQAQRQPHEYARCGTAKLLTLFCLSIGEVPAKGGTAAPNAALHPWLQQKLTAVLDDLPAVPTVDAVCTPAAWQTWQQGLKIPITLPAALPALRLLLVWDNLAGHLTPALVVWLFAHGVMPFYTPLGASWLNMAVNPAHHQLQGAGRAVSADTAAGLRQHALAGSGACARRALRHGPSVVQKSLSGSICFRCQK